MKYNTLPRRRQSSDPAFPTEAAEKETQRVKKRLFICVRLCYNSLNIS